MFGGKSARCIGDVLLLVGTVEWRVEGGRKQGSVQRQTLFLSSSNNLFPPRSILFFRLFLYVLELIVW
jgi:hypothetical protein